jgi:nicotinamidase-related amidase
MNMSNASIRSILAMTATMVFAATGASAARAQSVIDEWDSVKAPPAPKLRAVTVDPRTTALFVMDFRAKSCSTEARPRCAIDAPKIAELLKKARAAKMIVVNTLAGTSKLSDTLPMLAPAPGETVIHPGLDKFLDQDMVADLRKHGIKRVILTGTSANGAVLFSAAGAVERGFEVVVPVDAMPADKAYQEQFTAWDLANGPDLHDHVVLTRTDMVKFGADESAK